MCICVCVCCHAHVSTGSCGSQKRTLSPLRLEQQAVVSCLVGILGILLRFSIRTVMLLTTELYVKLKSSLFKKLNETVSIIFLGVKMHSYKHYLT